MKSILASAATVLLAAACSSSAASAAYGAINGRVLSAPSCPVVRACVPCQPRPVVGAAVAAARRGQVVASTHTDAQGYFHMGIPQGRFTVRATNAGGLRSTTSKVVVIWAERKVVYVRLLVDSGIR